MQSSIFLRIPAILKITILAILLKLLYLVFAYALLQANLLPPTIAKSSVISLELFKRNDSDWYERIYKEGYEKLDENAWQQIDSSRAQVKWAFFPMYPLLVKATSKILQTDFVQAAFVDALVLPIFCFYIFYLMAVEYFKDEAKSWYATALFMCFPFHYYFSMMYSEALFASLLLLCFYTIKNNRYLIFIAASAALVLCRVNGLVMILPLFIYFAEQNGILKKYHIDFKKIDRSIFASSMMFLFMLLAFACYAIYQMKMTGTYFAFSKAQSGWWRELKMPYESFFARGDLQAQFNSSYVILFLIIAVAGFKKLPLSYNILIWISMLLPLISGATQSMQRFIIVMFPFMFLFTLFIFDKMPRFKFPLLIVLLALQLWTFYFWIIGDPFSY